MTESAWLLREWVIIKRRLADPKVTAERSVRVLGGKERVTLVLNDPEEDGPGGGTGPEDIKPW